MKDCLIAAQYPVTGAGLDLIRLLIDQDCTTLVSLNPLSKVQSVSDNHTYNISFFLFIREDEVNKLILVFCISSSFYEDVMYLMAF